MHLLTDSACVHLCVSDMLTGKAKVHTKAANEMLIRRQFDTLKKLVEEYELLVNDIGQIRPEPGRETDKNI